MLPINDRLRKRIEGLLEPGFYVQLEQSGNNILVHKRPKSETDIDIPPACATMDRTVLVVNLQNPGEDPVSLLSQVIEKGSWVLGVKMAKGTTEQEG